MASRQTRLRRRGDVVPNRCTSQKTSYANYSEALTAAEQIMERGHVTRGCHITPYLCDSCDRWHVWNRPIVFPKGRLS
jgi:hypothetical protein